MVPAVPAFPARHIGLALAAWLLAAGPAAAQQLSVGEAQALATAAAPQLIAQSAAVRAAREGAVGAGELPDPKLLLGVQNIPAEGDDRFRTTRDSMSMRNIGVMQEFPREEKRRLRADRAQAEVRREQALLAVAEVNLLRDVAMAWVDAWSAEQQVRLLEELARETDLNVTASEAALAGGRGAAAEPFAARLARSQLDDRMTEARRMATRAREQLARYIGRHATRPLDEPPPFERFEHDHMKLIGELESHPHLAMYGPMQDMADTDVKLAEAAKRPDWSLEAMYGVRGRQFENMFAINVRIDLPIFEAKRQNPAIASRLAAADQVRSQAEDARRAHLAEVRVMLADWRAAQERVRRIEAQQVPLARERVNATLAAYGGGRGELMPVLEARRMEIDTRMGLLMARTEMGRAWAQLNFLLPSGTHKEKP